MSLKGLVIPLQYVNIYNKLDFERHRGGGGEKNCIKHENEKEKIKYCIS